MEFPAVQEVLAALDSNLKKRPDSQLFVLSEFTFDGEIPSSVRRWCKKNRRWLIAGGRDEHIGDQGEAPKQSDVKLISAGVFRTQQNFRNTAFVINPDGETVFAQAKAQPIQFFQDGLPAATEEPWNSPWGKIGLAICYDLSYRRVMDVLIRKGAHALIIPAMDLVEWGAYEHELNARQTKLRAREYGVPVFRLASSGISQYVLPDGRVMATAPFPPNGQPLVSKLRVDPNAEPRVPFDSWLAPACTILTGLAALAMAVVRPKKHASILS
jgi:apolipoprotein N-acyltransferase